MAADPMIAVLVERVNHLIDEVRAQAAEHVTQSDCRGTHIGTDAAIRDLDRRINDLTDTFDRAAGRRWQMVLAVATAILGAIISIASAAMSAGH